MAEQTFPTYPVGTKLKEIKGYDRGQKVCFQCPVHPDNGWFAAKSPSSTWFGQGIPCDCWYEGFVLVAEYTPTRIG